MSTDELNKLIVSLWDSDFNLESQHNTVESNVYNTSKENHPKTLSVLEILID